MDYSKEGNEQRYSILTLFVYSKANCLLDRSSIYLECYSRPEKLQG